MDPRNEAANDGARQSGLENGSAAVDRRWQLLVRKLTNAGGIPRCRSSKARCPTLLSDTEP
jgi:hypothetical protein